VLKFSFSKNFEVHVGERSARGVTYNPFGHRQLILVSFFALSHGSAPRFDSSEALKIKK
jgi:hypothetical protein